MSFNNIIGNDKIKTNLIDMINKKNISQAYMFIGQDGIGKQIFARQFAKEILCLSNKKEDCNECDSCIKFSTQNHPDFINIEPEGNTLKISQIREMQEYIYQKPIISEKKVFIINDAEKMTEDAQNSLLKTLEEPPFYIVIILIVSNENRILNTIRSRCLKINFLNLEKSEIENYINENKLIQNPSDAILEMCNGSIGKAKKIIENLDIFFLIEKFMNNIINNKYKSLIELLNDAEILYKSKENIFEILEYMIVIIFIEIGKNKENSQCLKYSKFLNIINVIETTRKKMYSNSNYDMTIDELLFKIWKISKEEGK